MAAISEALRIKPKQVKTNCAYCGVGCGINMIRKQDGSWQAKGDEDHPSNRGQLCQKGSTLGQTISHDDRILQPSIKGQQVSDSTATSFVAEKFKAIIDEHGPESIGLYVSGQLLTEDYYVANKFVKGYLGSANIDTNSRLCMASTVVGHKRAFGGDLVPACYEDFDHCNLLVITGSNMSQCHPVLFQRALQRPDRPYVVCIDPRETKTAQQSDLHLAIAPDTDIVLFNGLLKYLHDHDAEDKDFTTEHVSGLAATIDEVSAYTVSIVADLCKVDESKVRSFYRKFLKEVKTVTVFSQGINQSTSGVDKVNAIINTHLFTGRIGKPGSAPFSLTGQFNAMGGREVGGLANQLAAHWDINSREDREKLQSYWQSPHICQKPGLKAVELFQAAADGKIKALWIMATNPIVSLPHKNLVKKALSTCPLVIVSESFVTSETLGYADVILPAATWGEKDGTTTNSERVIARQKAFLPAPGSAKHDYQWICSVARDMGFAEGFSYASPSEIFQEHAELTKLSSSSRVGFKIAGICDSDKFSYDHFKPIQWPVANKEQGEGKRLFTDGRFFTSDQKAKMIPVSYQARRFIQTHESQNLVLNTGRLVNHWHTMTRTTRASSLYDRDNGPFCHMHPMDIEELQLRHKIDQPPFLVKIENPFGQSILRLQSDPHQNRGSIFIPFHWNNSFGKDIGSNQLISPEVDTLSGQPGFKASLVEVRPLAFANLGIMISRSKQDLAPLDWWQALPLDGYYAYLLADNKPMFRAGVPTGHLNYLLHENFSESSSLYMDEGAEEVSQIKQTEEGLEFYLFLARDHRRIPTMEQISSLLTGKPSSLTRDEVYFLHSCSGSQLC